MPLDFSQFRAKWIPLVLAIGYAVPMAIAMGAVINSEAAPVWAASLSPSPIIPSSTTNIIAGDPNGTPSDSPTNRIDPNTTTSPFAGVGSINGSCTGVAITSRHILTAAHCVNNNPTVTFYLNYGSQTSYTGTTTVHPGYNSPFNDLGIVTLSQDLPTGVPIYQLYGSPIPLGTTLTMVGYGMSGDGVNGVTVPASSSVKRIGKNNADAFLDNNQNPTFSNASLFVFDFDGPTAATNYLGSLTLGNDVETTFYSGDSGGPSFIYDGTSYKLAGINTFIFQFNSNTPPPPLFGSGGGGVDVSYYSPWINSITNVPFEFSPLWGIGLVSLWFTLQFWQRRRKKRRA